MKEDICWLQHQDYDLEVSNYGDIRKLFNKKELKPSIDSDGYLWYMLRIKGRKPIKKFIHTLVLEIFIKPRPSKNHVGRHIDANKRNNYYKNLIWGLPLDNIYDRLDVNDNKIFFNREIIIKIKNDLLNGMRQKDIVAKYKISRGVVHLLTTEKSWKGISPSLKKIKTDTRNHFTEEKKIIQRFFTWNDCIYAS